MHFKCIFSQKPRKFHVRMSLLVTPVRIIDFMEEITNDFFKNISTWITGWIKMNWIFISTCYWSFLNLILRAFSNMRRIFCYNTTTFPFNKLSLYCTNKNQRKVCQFKKRWQKLCDTTFNKQFLYISYWISNQLVHLKNIVVQYTNIVIQSAHLVENIEYTLKISYLRRNTISFYFHIEFYLPVFLMFT